MIISPIQTAIEMWCTAFSTLSIYHPPNRSTSAPHFGSGSHHSARKVGDKLLTAGNGKVCGCIHDNSQYFTVLYSISLYIYIHIYIYIYIYDMWYYMICWYVILENSLSIYIYILLNTLDYVGMSEEWGYIWYISFWWPCQSRKNDVPFQPRLLRQQGRGISLGSLSFHTLGHLTDKAWTLCKVYLQFPGVVQYYIKIRYVYIYISLYIIIHSYIHNIDSTK